MLIDRFWAKVEVDGETGCWEWRGCKTSTGYGMIRNGKMNLSHRVSYELHRGQIPDGLHVLHRCDNPSCVNHDHVFLGTHAENMADRNVKGRQASQRGEAHGCAKLTAPEALAIREAKGISQYVLADMYGISQKVVSDIRAGRLWSHI